MAEDVDLGPAQVRLAQFAGLNPQLHPENNWSGMNVPGAPFYVPIALAEARGKPPLPSRVYQAFSGFMPRPGMSDAQILAGITSLMGGV
jgi:hypothetical protein